VIYTSFISTVFREMFQIKSSKISKESERLLDLTLKTKAEFRIKKVEVQKWEAIDQIKFHYDDNTEWYVINCPVHVFYENIKTR